MSDFEVYGKSIQNVYIKHVSILTDRNIDNTYKS